MSIELIIDTREQELIEKLKNIPFKIEQLDIGDILFRQNNEIVLIIERKTVSDLKASICDGRNREQKARILSNTPLSRIMYIIEGSLDKPLETKISGLPVSTLIGSLINTQLRDGIKVYKTSSISETVEFIRKLSEKLEKNISEYFTQEDHNISASEYSTKLKKNKKANMTPKVWFNAQLSLIPHITEKISEVVIAVYPSVSSLILKYEQTPVELRERLLSNLTYTIKDGKTRRVGDKMSSRIYNFLYNIPENNE